MNSQVEVNSTNALYSSRSETKKKSKAINYLIFLLIWLLLIASGIVAALKYTEHLKMQITQEVTAQTRQQLAQIQQDYQKQIDQMKQNVDDNIKMQTKIDSFNQLLTFVKDSASSKTDNSNQLYTQLNDVKKQLDELKKSLDVLK